MSMRKCPKCGSTNVRTERRINGNNTCLESSCGHVWPMASESLMINYCDANVDAYLDKLDQDEESYCKARGLDDSQGYRVFVFGAQMDFPKYLPAVRHARIGEKHANGFVQVIEIATGRLVYGKKG